MISDIWQQCYSVAPVAEDSCPLLHEHRNIHSDTTHPHMYSTQLNCDRHSERQPLKRLSKHPHTHQQQGQTVSFFTAAGCRLDSVITAANSISMRPHSTTFRA